MKIFEFEWQTINYPNFQLIHYVGVINYCCESLTSVTAGKKNLKQKHSIKNLFVYSNFVTADLKFALVTAHALSLVFSENDLDQFLS